MLGGSIGLLGLLLNAGVAVLSDYRSKWFFWASLGFAGLYCVIFPIGTVVGAGLIVYLLIKRREFLKGRA